MTSEAVLKAVATMIRQCEGLIPARRQPRDLRLREVEFVKDHGEVIARLSRLAEGEPALGIVGEVVASRLVRARPPRDAH